MMLEISSLGNVVPSYFPKTISNLTEFLNSLIKNFAKPTVLLLVANKFGAVSKVPSKKPNCSPLYGRDMTLAPELFRW